MRTLKIRLKFILHKFCLLLVISIGLISIIGTGSDDDSGGGTTTANSAPIAMIDSPAASTVYSLNNSITFTGSASDTEDLVLTGKALSWTSSLDGAIGSGSNFTTSSLSAGTHQITLTAIDSKESADSTVISITVNPANNTLPVATITSPSTGITYNLNDFIEFTGTGYDTEDAWLSGTSLVWHSNKDGQLGTGNTVTTSSLSGGTHTISLTVTDSFNTSNTAKITTIVLNTPPTAKINYPPDGSIFTTGDAIPFDGTGTDSEDGNLTGGSLVWTADNYGIIGFGTNISIDFLPLGTDITINLKAIDGGDLVDSDNITITIQAP